MNDASETNNNISNISAKDDVTATTIISYAKEEECHEIEAVLLHSAYNIVMNVQLCLLVVTLVAILVLVHQHRRHRILLHGNLMLLFRSIVLLYTVHTIAWLVCLLRYRILLSLYTHPCQLLTPLWLVMLLYGPYYLSTVTFPALYFCIMLERARATLRAEKYEREDQRLGWQMVAAIWLLSGGYIVYICGSALADDQMGPSQGVMYLTSRYNAKPIFCVTIGTLALIIGTAVCDWRILVLNRRIRDKNKLSPNYSLSRNYQLHENALAMRLILPLDLSYALLYSLYTAVVLVIRALKSSRLSNVDYTIYYNSADTLHFLHSALIIVVYIHFVKSVSRARALQHLEAKRVPTEQARMHFRQLELLWR